MAQLPKSGIHATHDEIFRLSRDQAESFQARADAFHSALKARQLEAELRYRSSGPYHNRSVEIQEVNEYHASNIMDTLWRFHREAPDADITVRLTSPGGSVFAGLAMYDTLLELRHAGHHVTTVSYGFAASMGSILLQAGTTRLMAPNAYLMIHEVSAGVMGSVSDVEDRAKFMKRLQDQGLDILSERSTLSRATIKSKSKRTDWWLDAQEALDSGFIDAIARPETVTPAD